MDTAERERLEAAGFRVGSVAEFIELTSEEEALVETELALDPLSDVTRGKAEKNTSAEYE